MSNLREQFEKETGRLWSFGIVFSTPEYIEWLEKKVEELENRTTELEASLQSQWHAGYKQGQHEEQFK